MNNAQTVKVWDILVRLFHWSLVVSFIIAYFTDDEGNIWHIYSGYTVLGLILFRVLWGLIGTRYARFSHFVYSPATVFRYLRSLLGPEPKHYTGHNPAGGWMVIALLISLFVVTLSGLKVYAIEEGKGPFADNQHEITLIARAHADEDELEAEKHEHDESEEEFWEEIHETSTNFTLILIFLHIAGVIVASRLHHENLVKAMFTGRKQRSDNRSQIPEK